MIPLNLSDQHGHLMETQPSPPVTRFLPAALILAIAGWGGLIWLFQFTLPTVGPRWMFFFLFFLALTGTALPFVAFLHRRFPSNPPASGGVVLRQAIWFGVYCSTLAWLQYGRVLTSSLLILLLIGFVLVEWLLRLRERSQWRP